MRQLQTRHFSLFGILRDYCPLLTRRQIERFWTLPTNKTNEQLLRLVSEKYLRRRYRADTFGHFQAPAYYLGELGWQMAGKPPDEYKGYRRQIENMAERRLDHLLAVYDVILKFLKESRVRRFIRSEDQLWLETIDFGNIPDAWIQFAGGEAFIEVDLATERPIVLERKFDNYVRFHNSGQYGRIFPDGAFKVLVLTTSEERIESLQTRAKSDDIWFCTLDEFLREPLDHAHWFARRGFYALSVAGQKEV
jgi:hypothetical protein